MWELEAQFSRHLLHWRAVWQPTIVYKRWKREFHWTGRCWLNSIACPLLSFDTIPEQFYFPYTPVVVQQTICWAFSRTYLSWLFTSLLENIWADDLPGLVEKCAEELTGNYFWIVPEVEDLGLEGWGMKCNWMSQGLWIQCSLCDSMLCWSKWIVSDGWNTIVSLLCSFLASHLLMSLVCLLGVAAFKRVGRVDGCVQLFYTRLITP